MVCKMIFRFNIEDTKIHQMLEALEHPLGSPRIFEAKERGECFAPLGHLPLTRKGRVGCSALSSLRSLGFFEFSILAFSIFDFDILIFDLRNDHLGYLPYKFHAPNTSRYVVLLDFHVNCHNFWNLEKCDFLFFSFWNLFFQFCLQFQKSNLSN